jgi:selenocysteine-specific elongation factor
MTRCIIGTAGHIDHGKTALVEALTGVRTDRLPEEQRRGITIDLGFAFLDLEDGGAGVVDVPGHEDFIRNMVAGASGFDVLLLVVAADEGVMPQTREHVAIAELLGVPRAVVALTKADLVDPDWLELVTEDVAGFLAGTRYARAPMVPTSVVDRRGLEALRDAIQATLPATRGRSDDLFRLPVDRVFTVRGTGTVVTGTVWSGRLRRDEHVRILPGDRRARVRGLQVHGSDVEGVEPGQRAAVALAGVDRAEAGRGTVLVTDAAWSPTRAVTAWLRVLPASRWRIEHGQRLRVHLGTSEVMARAFLVGDRVLEPGDQGWAQLRLEAPIIARTGDRLVLRSYSPVTTIGGGVVSEPWPRRRRRLTEADREWLTTLIRGEAAARVAATVDRHGTGGVGEPLLPILTGATPGDVRLGLGEHGAIVAGGKAFPASASREVAAALLRALADYHAGRPLHRGMDPEQLRRAAPPGADDALVGHALGTLLECQEVLMTGGRAALPGFSLTLTDQQQRVRDRVLQAYADAGPTPPRIQELASMLGTAPELQDLVALLEADGLLVRLDPDLLIHRDHLDRIVQDVRGHFGGRGDVTPAEFRDVVRASRRHLIPILEYLDRAGITVRAVQGRAVPRP